MFSSILQILGTALVISLLAILVERILISNGFARGNQIGLVVAISFLVTLVHFADYKESIYLTGLFMIIMGPIAVNRYDLTMTIKHGRWWWKKENLSTD